MISTTLLVKNTGITGIEDQLSLRNIEVYPNPTLDILNINTNIQGLSFQIVSAVGKEIMTGSLDDIHVELNTSLLSQGLYFIKFSNGEIKKIIKN